MPAPWTATKFRPATGAAAKIKRRTIRATLVGLRAGGRTIDPGRWRLAGTVDGVACGKAGDHDLIASLGWDGVACPFLRCALGRASADEALSPGATAIRAEALPLDGLLRLPPGAATLRTRLARGHPELGEDLEMDVRVSVGDAADRPKAFAGWVHCALRKAACASDIAMPRFSVYVDAASPANAPPPLPRDGGGGDLKWRDEEPGLVVPLRAAAGGATPLFAVALFDGATFVGSARVPLTAPILGGGRAADVVAALLDGEQRVGVVAFRLQALAAPPAKKKDESSAAALGDLLQVDTTCRFLQHPRCRGRLDAFCEAALTFSGSATKKKGSLSRKGTDTHPAYVSPRGISSFDESSRRTPAAATTRARSAETRRFTRRRRRRRAPQVRASSDRPAGAAGRPPRGGGRGRARRRSTGARGARGVVAPVL